MDMYSNSKLSGFLRLPDVLKLYPVSKSTWWAGVKEGRYPQPVKLGPKMTAWRSEDIYTLINTVSQKGGESCVN